MPLHSISFRNICSCFPSHYLNKRDSIEFEKISAIPKFEKRIDRVYLSSEEIQKIVGPVLKDFFSKAHYNRLNLTCQYIDYYNKLERKNLYEITPLEALETFIPDLQGSMATTNGGSCCEFIEDVTKKFPSFLKYNLIPSTAPTQYSEKYQHKLSHIAALIDYTNPKNPLDRGYILVDPSFELDEPIIIPFQGVSKKVTSIGGNIIVFSHEGDTILGKMLSAGKDGEDLHVTYFLKKITNFIDVAIKPLIASSRKISLMTYGDSLENNSDLCIRLDKESITWGVGFEWKPIVTFNEFLSKRFRFDQKFSKSAFLDINKVNNSIEKIILHKQLLETLYSEYIDALKKSPRSQEFLIDI